MNTGQTVHMTGIPRTGIYAIMGRYCYYWVDTNTRIEFGFHFRTLGLSYYLQRKTRRGWKRVAWTYHSLHTGFGSIRQYLLWCGEEKK
ncbi:MAG: hypothetical protein RBS73_09145 [Prolixibacteraceae bacterium]|jgi:hypothetical protein|nr:hypothetical protein [Prolixibacteraceae bacterium]